MKHYIVSLKPMAPYFFGGERNFAYGTSGQQAQASPYFIESEQIPSQSTLFGLTRYLGIKEKREDYVIEKEVIGEESFTMEKEDQTFGKIIGISGLFMEQRKDGKTDYLIPVPFDHNTENQGAENASYHPMTYGAVLKTTEGEMLIPKEYKAKNGFSDDYMSVTDGSIVKCDDIFKADIQTKISKSKEKEAFFKKKYWILQKGYAFAYELCVEDDFPEITDAIVYMGKEKSPFALLIREGRISVREDLFQKEDTPGTYVKRVALSDCYLPEEELYECCYMTYLEERTHREFYTRYGKEGAASHLHRFNKREFLYHLVRQGSVFLVKPECVERFDEIVNNAHRKTAGYNRMSGGK